MKGIGIRRGRGTLVGWGGGERNYTSMAKVDCDRKGGGGGTGSWRNKKVI